MQTLTQRLPQKITLPQPVRLLRFGLPVVVFALILLVRVPPVLIRPVSIQARYGATLIFPLILTLTYLIMRLERPGSRLLSLTWVAALFALSLNGLWASVQSDGGALGGLLPWSDNGSYYAGALRILNGFPIAGLATRRPLYSAFYSVALLITGRNLMLALALETLLGAYATAFAAQRLRQTHGPAAAALAFSVIFFFYRRHTGTVATENLGLVFGLLGFGLLWQSLAPKRLSGYLLGLLALTLALNVRPGAMFVLPLLVLAAGWFFRGERRFSFPALTGGAAVVGLVFLANTLVFSVMTPPGAKMNDNLSYLLYGIAKGGQGWNQYQQDFPACAQLSPDDCSNRVMRAALSEISQHPLTFVRGAASQYPYLVSESYYSLFSFIQYNENDPAALNWPKRLFGWGLYGLSILGLAALVRGRKQPHALFTLLLLAGFLLSVPFAPPSDANRLRMYAATICVVAVIPALGLTEGARWLRLDRWNPIPAEAGSMGRAPVALLATLTACTLVVPLILLAVGHAEPAPAITCEAGLEPALVNYLPGTYLTVERESELFLDWAPRVHAGRFFKLLHSVGAQDLIGPLYDLQPPLILLPTVDPNTGSGLFVAADAALLPPPGGKLALCGQYQNQDGLTIYVPASIESFK